MTNEQIVLELRDVQERLSRSLTVIEACTESFEMAARCRRETLRTVIRIAENIVSRIKKVIETCKKEQEEEQ